MRWDAKFFRSILSHVESYSLSSCSAFFLSTFLGTQKLFGKIIENFQPPPSIYAYGRQHRTSEVYRILIVTLLPSQTTSKGKQTPLQYNYSYNAIVVLILSKNSFFFFHFCLHIVYAFFIF
jgi:hypothetical protein